MLEIVKGSAPPQLEQEEDLFELANLYPGTTGLPMTVWVSPKGGARHDVRVKVCQKHGKRMDISETAVVGVRPRPELLAGELASEDFAAAAAWIALNTDALIAYWDGAIDTVELCQLLRRV